MALKFQYNKTAQQQLVKQLGIREKALPTLKAKESALRNEVKNVKEEIAEVEKKIEDRLNGLGTMDRFWCEFPALVSVADVNVGRKSIAGVKTPYLEEVVFDDIPFSWHGSPNWFLEGIDILKSLLFLRLKRKYLKQKFDLLDYARKKTTQKVNLYEKIQVPEYKEAIIKIKRYLEDEENLAKSSQKILKAKLLKEASV